MHPTWQQLRKAIGQLAGVPPLDDEKCKMVRSARYRGRMRLLRRMEAGVIRSLEVKDASPISTALMTLQRWMERIAKKEVEHITVKCRRYQHQGKPVPAWVRAGMDERFRTVEQIEQRVQMLLGSFASHGALPLEFKPAYSVGDLLLQRLDALEQEAEEKGGIQQILANHFAKVYKGAMPIAAWPVRTSGKQFGKQPARQSEALHLCAA